MQRNILAAFRESADGRSLVRALAALVVCSAFVGSFSASFAATDFDHCISPSGALPADHHDLNCCPGMAGGPPSLPPPAAPAIELPWQPREQTVAVPHQVWIPEALIDPGDRPRGPPATA